MNDRNWEAELAKIDKQLSSISDEQLLAEKRAAATRPGSVAAAGVPAAPGNVRSATAPLAGAAATTRAPGWWKGWVQAAVACAAGAGLWFWPWAAQCGMPLYGFVGATAGVAVLGAWSAVGTWRHRLSAAHVLSLSVILFALVLGAREVLPRTGYAVPDGVRGTSWSCTVPVAEPAVPSTPEPVAPAIPPASPPVVPPQSGA